MKSPQILEWVRVSGYASRADFRFDDDEEGTPQRRSTVWRLPGLSESGKDTPGALEKLFMTGAGCKSAAESRTFFSSTVETF